MARIAYLTGRAWRKRALAPDTLPDIEAADHALILKAGAAKGLKFEVRYWDDETLPAQGFDCALIRSCWDYPDRYDEFLARLDSHERAGLRLFNSAATVKWNSRKTYLKQLGAAAIDTIWADTIDPHVLAQAFDALDAAEIVVKPQVGAGSRNTLRLKRNAWSDADLRDAPPGAAMLQPYLRAIESEGERSLFWFGDEFSHAVRKVPKAGDWFANKPENARFFAEAPPAAALAVAEAALELAPADLLYARIDLVLGDDGRWRVIEIEAIEPYLFLAFAPEGADVLARALSRVLGL